MENCLERATAASGEGSRPFVHLFADAARAEADAIDRRRRAGIWTGWLGGIPLSVKDLLVVSRIFRTFDQATASVWMTRG